MANLTPMPFVFPQFFNQNGDPAASHRLFTYAAGTTTKQTTYTDVTGSVAQANPIVLNSDGRPSSVIYLPALPFKFWLAPPGTDDPPGSSIWTADNIYPAPPTTIDVDVSGVAGASLTANDCVYLSDGSGGRTSGRWYQTDQDTPEFSTLARAIGFVLAAASTGDAITVRRMGRLTGLSGLTAGSLYYVSSTAGAITSTAPSNPRRVGQADGTTSLIIAAEIEEPIKGYIHFDLTTAREVAANVTQNAAANGGILASDTTPILQRVNGATDKALRINWAAGNVDEITWCFSYPPDLDDANNVTVHILAAMTGATNTPVMTISYFEGVGDTDAGSSTAAITGTTVAEYSITVTAANIGAHPNFASISLVPGAHATDGVLLYAVWAEYVKKLKSS